MAENANPAELADRLQEAAADMLEAVFRIGQAYRLSNGLLVFCLGMTIHAAIRTSAAHSQGQLIEEITGMISNADRGGLVGSNPQTIIVDEVRDAVVPDDE